MITIYSRPGCSACVKAKEFFKNKNLEYMVINIDEDMDARDEVMRMGFRALPIIQYGDKEFVSGAGSQLLKTIAEVEA